MAPRSAWFRRRVNSGRLAEPPTYAASSIVGNGAGWVAPDVTLSDGGRLRDELGAGFVVVAGAAVPGMGVLTSDDPLLAGRAWIVRPDGYVADSVAADTMPADLERRVRRVSGMS